MFVDRRAQVTLAGGGAEFVGMLQDGRDEGRHALRVEAVDRLMVDQQAVPTENDSGIDAVALPDRRDEVANGGHRRSVKGCRSVRTVRVKSSRFRLSRSPSSR